MKRAAQRQTPNASVAEVSHAVLDDTALFLMDAFARALAHDNEYEPLDLCSGCGATGDTEEIEGQTAVFLQHESWCLRPIAGLFITERDKALDKACASGSRVASDVSLRLLRQTASKVRKALAEREKSEAAQ